MNGAGKKFFGTLLFIGLIFIISYLTLMPKKTIERKINKIEIHGNQFLSGIDYLRQTKLLNLYNVRNLSAIKDRLEKHPYIFKADVELTDKDVAAYITEKKMIAILLKGTSPYFISDKFEILPLIPSTKFVDIPVISNPKTEDRVKAFQLVKDQDLFDALRIIESARLVDEKMLSRLSEINLRDGGDILLTFSGYPVPVIFGRKDEARKIVYLESLWNDQMINNISHNNYIDLRFADNIYFCPESTKQHIGFIQ